MTIGFIGLGIMGSRMAMNLLDAGHELVVHNRTQSKADDLIAKGATWADTPREVAEHADTVITMLAHPEAVRDTTLGEDGFLHTELDSMLWIDCSTVNPSFVREMAQHARNANLRYVEAPVGGSKGAAADGNLLFFVGGDAADVEACQPLFDIMGRGVHHVGEHSMGTSLKIVVNYLLANAVVGFTEALMLGQGLGLSEEMLVNSLSGAVVTAPVIGAFKDRFTGDDTDTHFPLQWMQKDLRLATQSADEVNIPMPIANAMKELYQLANHQGQGEKDLTQLYHWLKQNL